MQCPECSELDGSHLMGCPVRTQHLKHEGLYPERQKVNLRERVFAEEWNNLNIPRYGLNSGYIQLENILLEEMYPTQAPGSPFRALKGEVTERDAFVAASVIQWLGTNCGQGFLQTVREKIDSQTGSQTPAM